MDYRLLFSDAIGLFSYILEIVIFVNVILSWIPPIRDSIIGRITEGIVGPVLNPIRRLIQKSPLGGAGAMLDFSPLIALLLLQFITPLIRTLILTL